MAMKSDENHGTLVNTKLVNRSSMFHPKKKSGIIGKPIPRFAPPSLSWASQITMDPGFWQFGRSLGKGFEAKEVCLSEQEAKSHSICLHSRGNSVYV